MRKKNVVVPLLLTLFCVFPIANLLAQQTASSVKTIEEVVRKTAIKKGKVDLKAQKAIYIEIPSQQGYLEFKAEGYAEIESILKEVVKQYSLAFQKNTNLTHSPACEWDIIPNAHPSTAIYRYCQFSQTIGYWQTCACATCCGTSLPPVMKRSSD